MAAAPKTLEELAQRARIELHGLHEFKEADFDLLMTELAVNATAQVKLRRQFRQLLAQELASSAQARTNESQLFSGVVNGLERPQIGGGEVRGSLPVVTSASF